MRPLARDGVVLDVPEPEVLTIETDRTLLLHVLRNLLTNALKFTATGHVRMEAQRRESGQHVEITVSDTGIGIAPEDQGRVFEEFFQVRNLLQVDRPGTGLGLPYARRVAEALGGTLRMESDGSTGSTFTLSLPLQWEALLGADRVPPIGSTSALVATALVVDDDEAFRHVLRGMLQGIAERVVEVADGDEALLVLGTSPPDVVFLDLQMPNVDGPEVLRRMAADPALRAVPVVVVTSVALDGPPAGAAALLPKAEVTRALVLDVTREAIR